MNWTGGSLQRTKHAHKGHLQQQRAYFAKARTQLQNAPDSPTFPFRPNWLRNADESDLKGGMSRFTASIRQPGHSAKNRSERMKLKAPVYASDSGEPQDRRSQKDTANSYASRRLGPAMGHTTCEPRAKQGTKRKAVEGDAEGLLLEANKKRLLKQRDWIGINVSKPVDLHFLSRKDKEKMGKRRQMQRSRGTTVRQRHAVGYVHSPSRPMLDAAFSGAFQSAAIPRKVDDIRIRIGTDALTNACSTQPNDSFQSQASSDSMLFDEDGPQREQERQPQLARPINRRRRATPCVSHADSDDSRDSPPTGEAYECYQSSTPDCVLGSAEVAFEQGRSGHIQLEPQIQHMHTAGQGSEGHRDSSPTFRMTHHVEGIERSLRLVFDGSHLSAGGRSCHASGDNSIGETEHAHEALSTEPPEMGHMHDVHDSNGRSIDNDHSAALAIVDEEPWKSFLAISDRVTRHSDMGRPSVTSLLHSYPTTNPENEAVANRSQHATQGDQTYTSSSSTSASLPSPKRGIGKLVPARPSFASSHCAGNVLATQSRESDRDEELWRGFVFGSERGPSSGIMHGRAKASGQWKSQEADQASSRYLSLSAAVSSVSSTPFESTSEQVYPRSGIVPDATAFAPPAGSWRISSPAIHGFVQEQHDRYQGGDRGERNASVTHLSLKNNASCDSDLISSRVFSDTRTSRDGLDRSNCARDMSFNGPSPGKCDLGRQVQGSSSSINGRLGTEGSSTGLDLVDANALR